MQKTEDIIKIQKHIRNAQKALDHIIINTVNADELNGMLEVVAVQYESAVLDVRRLCEKNKMPVKEAAPTTKTVHNKEIFGEVEILETGWVHIKLNTLLPNSKLIENSGYISDSIRRLLDGFRKSSSKLPFFNKAFVAVIERCNFEKRQVFDNDNKAVIPVINALKGNLFPDDNQYELSLGLFTELDNENCCHIYVMQENDAADFFYLRQEGNL